MLCIKELYIYHNTLIDERILELTKLPSNGIYI